MHLCTRHTLKSLIQTFNRTPPPHASRIPQSFAIFKQILLGLRHVHERGVMHRDLKPSNVFIDRDGRFMIGDFGLSKVSEDVKQGGVEVLVVMTFCIFFFFFFRFHR